MRQASAHKIHRHMRRALRRQQIITLHTLARIDPKSIERSTAIGVALFAASSIALQGFVVAQGSLSGKSSGMAQAAIVPNKAAVRQDISPTVTGSIAPQAHVDTDDPGLRRTDRLTDLSATVRADGRELPRIASLVPADTIISKPVTAADLGLRISTFGPGSIKEREKMSGIALSSRRGETSRPDTPKPTRVAFAGAPGHMANSMRDFSTVVEAAPPPARAPQTERRSPRVPSDIVQKVHFQDHTPERCLPNELINVIYDVAEKYGEVQILSTFRDPERNRRVGGAPRSYHLRCQAIDFRVMGSHHNGLLQYLASREDVGGLKRYPLGFYHIDTGPRRTW